MTTAKNVKSLIEDLRICLKGLDLLDIDVIVNFDDYNKSNMSTYDKIMIQSLIDRTVLTVNSLKSTVDTFNSYS